MGPSSNKKIVIVISDSTGETGEKVSRVALQQYPNQSVDLRVLSHVRTPQEIEKAVAKAARNDALLVFTLISPDNRALTRQKAAELGVETFDILGPLMERFEQFLGSNPINIPTLEMPLSEEYFRRVAAIEFAVKNDDGKDPRNLSKADLVLVGVSRTSKTPLSTYLAGKGLKVANVPIVMGIDPPTQLEKLNPNKIIGLKIDVSELLLIRRFRLKQLGMPEDSDYGLQEQVNAELNFAKSVFDKRPQWKVFDVTGRAIEETASLILQRVKELSDGSLSMFPISSMQEDVSNRT